MTRHVGIRIEGIEVFAHHGVLPEERAAPIPVPFADVVVRVERTR